MAPRGPPGLAVLDNRHRRGENAGSYAERGLGSWVWVLEEPSETQDPRPKTQTDRAPLSTRPTLDCWYLTGPTAGGKTGVGVALARMLNAEIISLDSMALYRGMDIGTAKPSREERLAVPHHLIDVLDCDQEFGLAEYVEAAQREVESIRGRGPAVSSSAGHRFTSRAFCAAFFKGPPPTGRCATVWKPRPAGRRLAPFIAGLRRSTRSRPPGSTPTIRGG